MNYTLTETEALKIDLIEEKNREKSEIKRKKCLSTADSAPVKPSAFDDLFPIEKEKLAEKCVTCILLVEHIHTMFFTCRHRMCGNESYRSADFEEAIVEYTKSLHIIADSRCYNNRAMACTNSHSIINRFMHEIQTSY